MAVDRLEKVDCCGCNACGDVCPVDAISFKNDIEGFWYPEVNHTTCINCNLCEKICPTINISSLKHNDFPLPQVSYAAININMRERWNSTSGGAFSVFANYMYALGGYVSGAIYTTDFHVENFVSNNPDDLDRLRSSKYLESYAEGLYVKIKKLLDRGEKVLACGAPCQMAALRSFLRKDYENLIVIDFICRGVNSPKVYRKYLDSLEEKYDSKIISVKAKNKELGWRNLTRKVTFANGKSYYGVLMEDDFRRGYHTNVYCRPSCYECVFKGFPRMSDITIGDYWGVEKYAPNLDNNIGTSLILLNSSKGQRFFETVKENFIYKKLPLEAAFGGNVALFNPIEPSKIDRKSFFEDLDKYGFDYVVNKYFPSQDEDVVKKKKLRIYLSFLKNILSRYKFNLSLYRAFYHINLRRETNNSIANGRYLIPNKGSVFDIDTTAKINIEIPIEFGYAPVKGMVIPSCLKMTKDTTFNVLGGPRDRYGNINYRYVLKYGAYIEIINGGTLTIHTGACNVGLTIMCADEITIGAGVRIGRNVSIRDYNGAHVIVSDTYQNSGPVHIGDRVWLCTGCTILPGVTIGEGAVVGANSTVTKDVPPRCLVVGTPAKVIKENIEWY